MLRRISLTLTNDIQYSNNQVLIMVGETGSGKLPSMALPSQSSNRR